MKMVKILSVILLLSSALSAGGKGFYVGGGIAGEYASEFINQSSPNDENPLFGLMVKAGYGIDNLAVELRSSKAWGIDDELSHTSLLGIYLKPNLDVMNGLNLYGLVGYGMQEMSFDNKKRLFYGYSDNETDQNTFSFGGGGEYAYSENIGIFVEVMQVIDSENSKKTDELDVDNMGVYIGVNYYFRDKKIKEIIPELPMPVKEVTIAILFDSGKSVVKSKYFEELNRYATFLNEKPNTTLDIIGHTDNRGSANYNQSLSQKRAESIKAYLVDQGLDASRITAIGKGEDSPRSSNETAEGRLSNRRIEAKINH